MSEHTWVALARSQGQELLDDHTVLPVVSDTEPRLSTLRMCSPGPHGSGLLPFSACRAGLCPCGGAGLFQIHAWGCSLSVLGP